MIAIQHANRASDLGDANAFAPDSADLLAAYAHLPPAVLLGVPCDPLTLQSAANRIEQMVASRQPHFVVTANADLLTRARRDLDLRRILLEAHLVLCEGTMLVWASRLLGNPLPERLAGADLAPMLIQLALEKNYRLFLLGASPEAAAQTVARSKARYPSLNLVGSYSPPHKSLREMDHAEITQRIHAARPDLLFVSSGHPSQETWIAMHYHELGVPVTIGVGAGSDFFVDRVKAAPRRMRREGLEWIFHFLRALRRLFKCHVGDLLHFGGACLAQSWEMQWRPRGARQAGPSSLAMAERKWQRVQVSERLDIHSIRRDEAVWKRVLAHHGHRLLDLSGVRFIDSTGVGLLVRLQTQLRRAGRHLILIAPGIRVLRALRLLRLEEFFEIADDAVEARANIVRRDEASATPVVAGRATRPLAWQCKITTDNTERVLSLSRKPINRFCARQRKVSIDLSDMRFVDCTGLGVRVRAKQFAERWGGPLRSAGVQPGVRRVLRLSKLESGRLDGTT